MQFSLSLSLSCFLLHRLSLLLRETRSPLKREREKGKNRVTFSLAQNGKIIWGGRQLANFVVPCVNTIHSFQHYTANVEGGSVEFTMQGLICRRCYFMNTRNFILDFLFYTVDSLKIMLIYRTVLH